MNKLPLLTFAVLCTLALSACGQSRGDRAITGGAIGGGVGAVGAAVVGGSVLGGAAIGAAAGAVVGAVTDQDDIDLGN